MHDKLALEHSEQARPLNLCTKTSLKFLSLWLWHYRAGKGQTRGEKGWQGMSDYREPNPCILNWDITGAKYSESLEFEQKVTLDKNLAIYLQMSWNHFASFQYNIYSSSSSKPDRTFHQSLKTWASADKSKRPFLNICWKNSHIFFPVKNTKHT